MRRMSIPCRLRLAAALVGIAVSSGACRYSPDGAAPLIAPAIYRMWWAELERCAEKTASFERIHFWTVTGTTFPCPGGPCVGRWQSPHNVYIADGWVNNASLVKHEMLHDLLGTGDHPPALFGVAGCNVAWNSQQARSGA